MVLQSFKFVNNIFYRFDLRCSNAKTFVEIKIIIKTCFKKYNLFLYKDKETKMNWQPHLLTYWIRIRRRNIKWQMRKSREATIIQNIQDGNRLQWHRILTEDQKPLRFVEKLETEDWENLELAANSCNLGLNPTRIVTNRTMKLLVY